MHKFNTTTYNKWYEGVKRVYKGESKRIPLRRRNEWQMNWEEWYIRAT